MIDGADPVALEAEPARPPGRVTARSSTFIGSFALAGRLVERLAMFGQIVLLASVYGSSVQADLYFVASIAPLLIGSLAGESLAVSLLPELVRARTREDVRGLVSAGFWLALAFSAAVLLLYLAVVVPLVELRLKGGLGELGPWLAFTPMGLLLCLSGFFSAVLLQLERYVWPPFRTAVAAVAGLALTGAALTLTRDLLWVALAVTAGHALSLLLLGAEVRRTLGLGWLRPPRRGPVRQVIALRGRVAAVAASGLLGGQLLVAIERVLAASLGVGAVSTLSYARGVAFTPNVVGHAIAAAIYPGMVREHEAERGDQVRFRFLRGLRLTLFLGLPLATFLAAFGPNLIGFLLQRGAFGADSAGEAGRVLAVFSVALFGNMLMIYTWRVFQSVDFIRATLWTQAAVLVVYLVLAQPLRSEWGLLGIAAAFSVAEVIGGLLALGLIVRRLGLGAAEIVHVSLAPALVRGGTAAAVLVGYRLVLEVLDVPQSLVGVAYVGGSIVLAAGLTGLFLWTSGWEESRRLVEGTRRLLRLG